MKKRIEGKRLQELLEIISRNRWELIRKRHIETENNCVTESYPEQNEAVSEISPSDVKVVLFAAQTAFSESIIKMFSKETVIAHFEDPEKIINFCCDYAVYNILLDIDPPSNTYNALDVFSSLKILLTDARFFVFTKHVSFSEAVTLKKRGAIIMEKPIFRKQVAYIVDKYLHETRIIN